MEITKEEIFESIMLFENSLVTTEKNRNILLEKCKKKYEETDMEEDEYNMCKLLLNNKFDDEVINVKSRISILVGVIKSSKDGYVEINESDKYALELLSIMDE